MGQKLQGYKGLFFFTAGSATVAANAGTTSGTKTITVDNADGIADGMTVAGTGIGVSAVVTEVDGLNITLSVASTATATGVAVTFTRAASKVKLANCSGWDIDIKADEIDASDHDTNGWKDKLDGLREYSGTVDKLYVTAEQTQFDLVDAMLSGSIDIQAEFRPIDKVGELAYSGTIRLTGMKHTAKLSSAQAINLTFSGRGALERIVIA